MADEWIERQLGGVIDIKHGFAFRGEFIHDEAYGAVLLTPGNFAIGGGFKAGKLKYYDGPIPDEFVLREGDLIVTMTDLSKQADTLGYPALVPQHIDGRRYLHNQRLGKIILKEGRSLDTRYLYYLMCSREYRHEVLASATGTTVRHTSPERIKRFRFKCPPPAEQRAIANVLGSLDDKIEVNRRMSETLEDMARAIFKSWFVDFDPVRAKVKGGHPYGMNVKTAALFPESIADSELGPIPGGWKVRPIGDAVVVAGGSTPNTKEPAYWNGPHFFATPKELAGLESRVLLRTERTISDSGLQRISSGLLPPGTVLLSSRAPIGYVAISEVPVAVNQGFIAMVCNKDLPPFYVMQWAASNVEVFKQNAGGTTFAEINKRSFRPIPVLVPPKPLLDAFEAFSKPLYERITASLRESDTLARLRDSLLPKLISGEVRIRDAEHMAEAAL